MAQNIKLKRSSVPGKVPTIAQLDAGELAINTADGKLYFEKDDNTIQSVVTTNAEITGSITLSGSISASGNFYLDGALYDSTDSAGVSGDLLTSTGTGLSWVNVDTAILDNVQTVYVTVKNESSATLLKGTPVHSTSSNASGNIVGVIAASASNASTMPATLVLNEELAPDAEGQAIAVGSITGVPTAGFTTGDIIYVGPSGGYTNSQPSGSNVIQNLGIVTKIHPTNGAGVVLGAGRGAATPNLLNGEIFYGVGDKSIPTPLADILTGSDATLNGVTVTNDASVGGNLDVTGDITGSDVTIGDWGSVSASLASISSGANSLSLQDVTTVGNTTTNAIIVTGFTSSANILVKTTNPGIIVRHSGSGTFYSGPTIGLQSDTWTTAPQETGMAHIVATDQAGSTRGSIIFEKDTNTTTNIKFASNALGTARLVISGSGIVKVLSELQVNGAIVSGNPDAEDPSFLYNGSVATLSQIANQSSTLVISQRSTSGGTLDAAMNFRRQGGGATWTAGLLGSDDSFTISRNLVLGSYDRFKLTNTGAEILSGSLYVENSITGSDVTIDDWGSVSASLASISTGANSLTLDNVTTAGNISTNDIFISSSKSLYLGANSYIRREQNGGGNENIQLNGSVRLNPNTSANANNGVVIGGNGYLLAPNSSRNAQLNYGSVSGQFGVYKLNVYGGDAIFQNDIDVTGGITGSGFEIGGQYEAAVTSFKYNGSVATLSQVAGQAYSLIISQRSTSGTPLDAAMNFRRQGGPATWTVGLDGTDESFTIARGLTLGSYDRFKLTNDGAEIISGSLYVENSITGSDVTIDDWGSVSASLSSISSGASSLTLDNVTTAGAITSNNIQVGAIGTTGLIAEVSGFGIPGVFRTTNGQNTTIFESSGSGGINPGIINLEFRSRGVNGAKTANISYTSADLLTINSSAGASVYLTGSSTNQQLRIGNGNGTGTGSLYIGTDPAVQRNGNGTVRFFGSATQVVNALTFSNAGTGAASGTTFNGSTARTISYNSVGAPSTTGTNATGNWGINITGTASLASTASYLNPLTQNVTITGNLEVYGSSSFTYVTSSQLAVNDSYISVNVFEPAERFGGLKVYDSGSVSHLATASLAWDSTRNHWVYANASGSTYSGGGLMSGPRNTGSLGDEQYPTYNTILRGQGGDHLYDSNITDNNTEVSVKIPLQVTGSVSISDKLYVENLANYGSDPDKFLSVVDGEIVYRTGAQLLSDIGGQTAGTFVQNAGGGGTARYIMRYADSNSATTSSIYEDTNGQIGIGTALPSSPLTVESSDNVLITATSTDAGAKIKLADPDSDVFIQNQSKLLSLGFSSTQSGQILHISSSGNVGIGTTSPSDILHVHKSGAATRMIVGNNTTYDQFIYFQGNTDWSMGIDYSNSNAFTLSNYSTIGTNDRITVTTGGNVGIGTTNPSSKLHVNGSFTLQSTGTVVNRAVAVTSAGTSVTLATIPTGSYDATFVDYVVKSSTNLRAGSLMVVWDGTNIEWSDTSTLDLGSTSGVEFAPTISAGNLNLIANVPGAGWTFKTHIRQL